MGLSCIEYMYRDFSNWKWFGEIIVDGNLELDDLKPYLWDDNQFNPTKLGLPHLLDLPINNDDHFMHEILDIHPVTDGKPAMTAKELVAQCSQIGSMDWFN